MVGGAEDVASGMSIVEGVVGADAMIFVGISACCGCSSCGISGCSGPAGTIGCAT